MTINNEFIRRLQKEIPVIAQVESNDASSTKRLNQMQREMIARDVAELINEFVPGLELIEQQDG